MKIVIAGVFIFAVAATRTTRYFGLEKWHTSLGFLVLAALFYLLNIVLIKFYITKKTPDLASPEEAFPGVQKWELTAGLGIVPKWVSVIGLLSISALITAIVPWIIALLK